ncbi:MAG TPA: AAA family ATPase, partial [Polyangiaceae bacterium]
MATRILALSGEVGAGKSTLARRLVARYGARHISTHVLLSQRLGSAAVEERGALQEAGERLDIETGGTWLFDELQSELLGSATDSLMIVDAIRVKSQLDALRQHYGRRITHLHL